MTTTRDLIQQLAGLAKREHYTCEDSWYNCPRSEDGSANDNAGEECDCGADEHNAKVDAICALLSQPEPEGLTEVEIADEARKYLVNECALPADITFLLDPDNFQYKPTIGCFRAVIAADRARCGRPKPRSLKSSSHL